MVKPHLLLTQKQSAAFFATSSQGTPDKRRRGIGAIDCPFDFPQESHFEQAGQPLRLHPRHQGQLLRR